MWPPTEDHPNPQASWLAHAREPTCLEFAMAEPTGGDPFIEGMDAFGRGVPREACPYPDGSEERELWLSGWEEAKALNARPTDEQG